MTVANVLTSRAERQLLDETGDHWDQQELLDYLNEGLRALARRLPLLFMVTEVVAMTAGAKQTLPAGGFFLFDVPQALTTGDAFYRVPRRVDHGALKAFLPGWRSVAAGPTREWSYNPEDPTVFWVNPPQPETPHKNELEYAKEPPLVDFDDALPVQERFDDALVEYMLYRAYSKDATHAGQDGRAQAHYNKFAEATGGSDSGSG